VQFHDVTANSLGARVELDDFASKAVFSPDGTRLLTLTGSQSGGQLGGLLQLWDPANGQEAKRITQSGLFTDAAFTPTGSLIVTGSEDGVTFWAASDGHQVGTLPAAGNVRQLSVSTDGTVLATVSDEGGEHLVGRLWRVAS
jgi:WD40 repeat protein